MTAFATMSVNQGQMLPAVREFLAGMLRSGFAQAVLAPVATADGRTVQPVLISEPDRLQQANPLLPVLPVSMARMISLVTGQPDSNGRDPGRIAVVLRPCELRAAVELAKLRQLDLAQIVTVGIDCVGTVEGSTLYAPADPEAISQAILESARLATPDGPPGAPYRPACAICATPVAWNADISLHFIGVPPEQGLLVEAADEACLERLQLETGADALIHRQAVGTLIEQRSARRRATLDAVSEQLHGEAVPGMVSAFAACQRCFNCTVACPICFCKQCLFRTEVFSHEPQRYLGWSRCRGAARLPGDTIAFQLTRLTHVTTSCVGCGLCTSACPAGLPVDSIFQTAARQTQALFDYVPGRDIAEPLPVATFKQDEFAALGERAW